MAIGIATGVLTVGARRELGEWVPVLAIERGESETRLRAGVQADRFIPHFLRKVVVDAYVEGIFSAARMDRPGKRKLRPPTRYRGDERHDRLERTDLRPACCSNCASPSTWSAKRNTGPGERWSLDLNWQP